MRILIYGMTEQFGGVEKFLLERISALIKIGYDIDVTFSDGAAEELNLYRVNTQGISSNNKIWQHLGSEYIREHYKDIEKISPIDIEKYINSETGKKHAKSYQEFYKFVSIFYQSKNSTDYYRNLLRYGLFLACCNYYGRKKVFAKLRELF